MIWQVRIESMAFKGNGVGHLGSKVTFVPNTVTGDEISTEIVEDKKSYFVGQLKEILVPSPWRIEPICPHFGDCGGCQWQHIDPSFQGEIKREILSETLKRLGKLDPIPSIETLPSPKPYGYRVRVQVRVKGKSIGYYQQGSHRVIDVLHCPIAHPLVNEILSILRDQRDFLAKAEEIEINVSPQEAKGVLILHPHSSDLRLKPITKQLLKNHPILKGIAVSGKSPWTLFGDPLLWFTIPLRSGERELSIQISPGTFFQIYPEQNQQLIQTVLEWTNPNQDGEILDLYAGAGNFTLPLAIHAGEVWGIEENKTAIEDARFNVERNGIQNIHFIQGEVEKVLKSWNHRAPDQIVLDPPRAGCKKIVDQIVRLAPERIVYVSCDPATFSRDVRLFTERGYTLWRLRLIDMFPQTYHMEAVGLLQRTER